MSSTYVQKIEGIEYYAYETACLEGTFQWHNTSQAQDITRTSATIAHIVHLLFIDQTQASDSIAV